MIRLYRLLSRRFAADPFGGEGSFRFGGRWSSPGTRLAYASEHQSLAMLEFLAHLQPGDDPDDLALAVAGVPDSVTREHVRPASLPGNWREAAAPAALARLGDDFARRVHTCLLFVPSALAPRERNCLINPAHPDFARIRIRPLEPFAFDLRLSRGRG